LKAIKTLSNTVCGNTERLIRQIDKQSDDVFKAADPEIRTAALNIDMVIDNFDRWFLLMHSTGFMLNQLLNVGV
jgi:hypothetical protein